MEHIRNYWEEKYPSYGCDFVGRKDRSEGEILMAVQMMFGGIVDESLLIEKAGSSIVYVAKERDSFGQFYKKFKERVFEPASRELPEAKEIKKNMLK